MTETEDEIDIPDSEESGTDLVVPTERTILDIFDNANPFEPNGDVLRDIPYRWLRQAEFNPKSPIHGRYRRGLKTSLKHFKFSDHLTVWPDPREIGIYLVLDGNQRTDVLGEMLEDFFITPIAKDRILTQIPTESAMPIGDLRNLSARVFKSVLDDPEAMREVRNKVGSVLVPCRIKTALDPAEAKLFNATFGRNAAKFDEGKVASLYEEYRDRAASLAAGDRAKYLKVASSLLRPELAFAPPRELPPTPYTPSAAKTLEPQTKPEVDPAEYGQWEPPPELPPEDAPKPGPAKESWQSVVFSFRPSNYRRLLAGILRSPSREIRERRCLDAVDRHKSRWESYDPEDGEISPEYLDRYMEFVLSLEQDNIPFLKKPER